MTKYSEFIHLKLPALLTSLVGVFPPQFIFEEDLKLRRIYHRYAKFILGWYVLVLASSYIEVCILCSEKPIRIEELCRNLAITLIFTMTLIRHMFIKFKLEFRNMIEFVTNMEKSMKNITDKMIKKIYQDCAKTTRQQIIIFMLGVLFMTVITIGRPFYAKEVVQKGNETVLVKSFPLSVWMPFDKNAHFWASYFINILYITPGACFSIFTDILILALITFATGQLKILHHVLENFELYKQNMLKMEYRQRNDEVIAFILFRKCVNMHQDVIKYVNNFNNSMSMFMVYDFLQTSLQLTTIIVQFIMIPDLDRQTQGYFVCFLIVELYRLLLLYYYANEICILSESLPLSIWKSNWYEQSVEVQKMAKLMMLNCKIPLKLKIGPFGYMTLGSFIAILKASYSYMMLIYNVNSLSQAS
uniref:Odorant receptor n=1 Tax=Eucryptorrhynchus brandti TaxID=436910 RepID=A0A8F4MZW2_EUCBR|nr:odorant receptor 18 [Eucryptorrhynchus brandti]